MSFSTPAPSQLPTPPAPLSPSPQPIGVLRSPQGPASALTALLSVGVAVSVVSAGLNLYGWKLRSDFLADPATADVGAAASIDMLIPLAGLAVGVLHLATAVVFLMWFHLVRRNGQVFRPDGFSQSDGWAIAGWFVPLANLFFPYRTARETWEASTRYAPDGSLRQVSGAPVIAWWLTFVASVVLGWSSVQRNSMAETAEASGDATVLAAMADLTTVAAAVLAVVFVRKLTAMQHLKAVQGPIAAV